MSHEFVGPIARTVLAAVCVVLSGCATVREAERDPTDIVLPYRWVGDMDKARLNEPSGVCFHVQRATLFIVGDAGDLCEMRVDGTLVRQKRIRAADFEGITHDPSTGLLYVAIEGKEAIIEVDPDTFEVLREFQLPRQLDNKTVLGPGGQGIEAITFIPDPDHPEGGTFYVANQSMNLESQDDLSAVFSVDLPLRSESGKPSLTGYFAPGVIDLSGLHYDPTTGHVFVISDSTNTLMEFSLQNQLIAAWALPGENQEGITVDGDGFIYIAQDSGGIVKLEWLR